MSKSKLKKCPFCGSEDIVVINIIEAVWMAKCEDCAACGPVSTDENVARYEWNKRAGGGKEKKRIVGLNPVIQRSEYVNRHPFTDHDYEPKGGYGTK